MVFKKVILPVFFCLLFAAVCFPVIHNRLNCSQPEVQIEIDLDKPGMIQLFYSKGNEFLNRYNIQKVLDKGTHSLRLPLPASRVRKLKLFRLDPINAADTRIVLKKFVYNDGKNFRQANLENLITPQNSAALKIDKITKEQIKVISTGEDPWIMFSARKMKKIGSSRICSLEKITEALCYTALLELLILLGIFAFCHLPVCRRKLPGCEYFLSPEWKRLLCAVLILSGALAAAAASAKFARNTQPYIKVEMESDKETLSQIFFVINGGLSNRYSSIITNRKGYSALNFAVPKKLVPLLTSLRFDPTTTKNSTLIIRKFTYFNGKKLFTLPLENLSVCSRSGIRFEKTAPDMVKAKVLNNDPYIYISFSDMIESACPPGLSSAQVHGIMLLSALIAAFLIWGIMKGAILRKRILQAIGIIASAAYLTLLLYHTDVLGKLTAGLLILCALQYLYAKIRKLPQEPPKPVKENFDWSMHYFRAFAISCICIGHILNIKPIVYKFFLSDSIYFLFISGYLCQYLFDKRPESPFSYYKKKLFNVICPYLIISILLIAVRIIFPHFWTNYLYFGGNASYQKIIHALLTGNAVSAFWYIPFVTILFLISPLLCRLKNTNFLQWLFFFGILSVIFPKRGSFFDWQETIYLYTYFTFAYLFGIAFARYRKELQSVFKSLFYPALFLGILLIAVIESKYPMTLNYVNCLQAVQKYCFIIVVLTLLEYIKNKYNFILDKLAIYSFTIFFLHMTFAADYDKMWRYLTSSCPLVTSARMADSWEITVIAFLSATCYLLLMLSLGIMLKKCIGKNSRYFIGS